MNMHYGSFKAIQNLLSKLDCFEFQLVLRESFFLETQNTNIIQMIIRYKTGWQFPTDDVSHATFPAFTKATYRNKRVCLHWRDGLVGCVIYLLAVWWIDFIDDRKHWSGQNRFSRLASPTSQPHFTWASSCMKMWVFHSYSIWFNTTDIFYHAHKYTHIQTTEHCNKLIMLLTDGGAEKPIDVLAKYNSLLSVSPLWLLRCV